MKRRDILKAASAALGLSAFPLGWVAAADDARKQKVLFFTRSAGYEHSVVHRPKNELSHAEKVLTAMGRKAGFDVVCSQDGAVFDGDLDQYDAIAFYTSGDLLSDKGNGKPMTAEGKQKLLDFVAGGKGFVGFHPCTDSFHSKGPKEIDPYITMVGAEFVTHGAQQQVPLRITSVKFPGVARFGGIQGLMVKDEWYVQQYFNKDLHVILVQDTKNMKGDCYKRPDYPNTWARRQGKGRVFYTAIGHREDVWTAANFQTVVLGGFAWVMGNVAFDPKPNIADVTPQANAPAPVEPK